jgi:hypothetical protein
MSALAWGPPRRAAHRGRPDLYRGCPPDLQDRVTRRRRWPQKPLTGHCPRSCCAPLSKVPRWKHAAVTGAQPTNRSSGPRPSRSARPSIDPPTIGTGDVRLAADRPRICCLPMPPGYSAVERRLVGVPTGRMGFDEEASGGRGVCGGGTDWCAERGVGGTDQRTQHRNTRSSCEDNTVRVVIKPDGGASGWDVDAQRELTFSPRRSMLVSTSASWTRSQPTLIRSSRSLRSGATAPATRARWCARPVRRSSGRLRSSPGSST